MIDSYFRPLYQPLLLDPLSKAIQATSINLVNYLLCLFGTASCFAITEQHPILGIALLLLFAILDTLDNLLPNTSVVIPDTKVYKMYVYRIVEVALLFTLLSVDSAQRTFSIFALLGSAYLCLTVFISFPRPGLVIPFGLIGKWESLALFFILILETHYFNSIALLFSAALLLTAGLQFRRSKSCKVVQV